MERLGRTVYKPVAAAVTALALGGLLVVGVWCVRMARTRLGSTHVRTLRLDDGSEVRVMERGGVYQSATYLGERWAEPVFAYYRAFDALFEVVPTASRVLMLGGGGFAYPKHVLAEHPQLAMDVVELDPVVVQMAERWFYFDRLRTQAGSRLRVFTQDARTYLEEGAASPVSPRYDAIVNDCFAGEHPVQALATVQALTLARENLRPGGVYLANIVSAAGGTDVSFLRDAVATASQVFAHVWVVEATDTVFGGEDNYLLIASDTPASPAGAIPFDNDFLGMPLVD